MDIRVFLGWVYVFIAGLCMGTYPAPMKAPSVLRAKVHPIIFQCYKVFWVMVTSWIILLIPTTIQSGGPDCHTELGTTISPVIEHFPYPFVFSIWGLISGVLNIFQVPIIGLGVSQGLCATAESFLSFFVGHFGLGQEVVSLWQALVWLTMVVVGVCGLATTPYLPTDRVLAWLGRFLPCCTKYATVCDDEKTPLVTSINEASMIISPAPPEPPKKGYSMLYKILGYSAGCLAGFFAAMQYLARTMGVKSSQEVGGTMYMCERFGSSFLPSFAIGSTICTGFLVFCLFLYRFFREACFVWKGGFVPTMLPLTESDDDEAVLGAKSYVGGAGEGFGYWSAVRRALPCFELRVMAIPGTIAGLLWSAGNFFVMAAITSPLANTIAMPAAVSWIFIARPPFTAFTLPLFCISFQVSGLWGIFYYREFKKLQALFGAYVCVLEGSVYMLGRQVVTVVPTPTPVERPTPNDAFHTPLL